MIRGMRLSDRIDAEAKFCICPENILDGNWEALWECFLAVYILFCSWRSR
jgi:hypothetical protein